MRIIVCGGRDYADEQVVRRELAVAALLPVASQTGSATIVHGDARGADRLAGRVAKELGYQVEEHPADWKRCLPECPAWHASKGYCPQAGHRRNQEMADAGADACIAFPGGNGTADMVRRARSAGIPVLEVKP